MSRVIILGGGGHASVVTDVLLRQEYEVIGFLDKDPDKQELCGLKRLGDDTSSSLVAFPPEEVVLANGFGSVGNNRVRKTHYQQWKASGYHFLVVRHPESSVARTVELSEGVQLMAGSVIQPSVVIGENSIVNTRAVIEHDCKIGRHVHIATGAILSGDVSVGSNAHVGAGAVVIQGVRIGKGSVVGAGSVVVRDVPDYTRVMGVPAHHYSKSLEG